MMKKLDPSNQVSYFFFAISASAASIATGVTPALVLVC
jgi:hypothetical protein